MKHLLLGLFFIMTALSGAPFFQEEFTTERSAKRYNAWHLKPELAKDAKGNRCLKLSLKERSANSILSVPFRPADLAGRWVEVSMEIRGEGIAASQQPWNGAKFMLTITTPETTLYPGCNVKTGTFDWETYTFRTRIPENATKIDLVLGFQDSFGTQYVRNLKLNVRGLPLDLRKVANFGFRDPVAGDGKGGWSDQGPDNDASRFVPRKNGLYATVPFQLLDPARNNGKSILAMKSANLRTGLSSATVDLKKPVKCTRLYLLHTLCHSVPGKAGIVEIIGQNGKKQQIAVTIGKDIADWWQPKRLSNACPAALWTNPQSGTVGIYASAFPVDTSVSPVKSVTFRSANGAPLWIILAATLSETEYTFPSEKKIVTKANAKWRPLPPSKPGVIAGSALDRSALTKERNVTKRVIINARGQLALEGSPDVPVRFLTVADSYETFQMFRTKKHIEEYARQLRLQGYNMARLHYLDSILMGRAKKALEFDPVNLDKFDYYVFCMKKNGIYLNLDAMCSRYGYDLGNTWYPDNSGRDFGFDIYFLKSVRENWRKGVGKLLTHVNPYTKTRLVDDPVLAIVNGKNEQEFALMAWQYPKNAHYMLPTWREFLKRRYSTPAAYAEVWKHPVKQWNDVPIFTREEAIARDRRGEDVARYKNELDRRMYAWYVKELRAMGYPGIVTNFDMGQNLRYIVLRKDFQAVGMHAYHGHPSQNGTLQTMDQSSSLANTNGMFRGLNSVRMTGKPLLITEYGIVFWNPYRYEQAFSTAAYAAFQDHSAITVHSQSVSILPQAKIRPFGCGNDPIIRASEFLTAYLFRRGDVRPASTHIRLDLDSEKMFRNFSFLDGLHHGHSRLCLLTGVSCAVDPDFPVRENEFALSTTGGSAVITRPGYTMTVDRPDAPFDIDTIIRELKKQNRFPRNNRTNALSGIFENSNNELYLDVRKKFMSVNTPKLQGICSEAGGAPVHLNEFGISNLTTRGNVALVSVDNRKLSDSRRMVLVYATNALNTGMVFLSPDMRTLKELGTPPVLVETGSFEFELKNRNAEKLRLYALATDGSRRFEIPLRKERTSVRAKIDTASFQDGPSLYFELVAE